MAVRCRYAVGMKSAIASAPIVGGIRQMAERVTGMKILPVDDDERFRGELRIILGIALNDPESVVDCAASFREALSRVTEASYDLLLFDYNLGSRTGLDVFRVLETMSRRLRRINEELAELKKHG
ncbi:MAG: response regulator [Deltaproteobacteria bacterium]|nr:response regulator [Deltaproteobacteria bacterium]